MIIYRTKNTHKTRTHPATPLLVEIKNIATMPFSGCPLGHHYFFPNPLRSAIMAVKVDLDKCTGCGECVSACPLDSIVITGDKAVVDDSCAECGACIDACPAEALSM